MINKFMSVSRIINYTLGTQILERFLSFLVCLSETRY